MFKDSPTAGHFSFRSCLGLNDLFKSMFKDSPTAGHFSLDPVLVLMIFSNQCLKIVLLQVTFP